MAITSTDIGLKATATAEDAGPDSKVVEKWLKDLGEARKLESEFRKEGHRIVELFEGEKKKDYQFNILYSNTETMLPALYNNVPRPVVQRRFKDEDPMGKLASTAAQRTLEYLIDNGSAVYTPFDDLMKSAVLEALVPGRGLTRFKYDATIEEERNEQAAEATESPEDEEDEGEVVAEAPESQEPSESVQYETVCGEEVPWDRFLHGNAKKWKDVPWCSIEHFMTREELEKNFGELGALIPVVEMASSSATADEGENADPKDDTKNLKVAQVYEIWDKEERTVVFVSPQWKKGPIKEVPDPLGLSGFYPWPRPLAFMAKISTLTPVALYTMYEEQAKELNRVTVRINKIIAALKVRGMYDSTVEGISKVLQADDNVLVPAENVAALLAGGNALEKAIWLMPIEKLVTVLQQLYTQREQVKTTIYEITGIADIMRGSSAASETLGAQQLKNQWGTLRLKKTQKEVMRYCRDCLRIMAEIAVTKLSPDTLKAMTGLPYPTGSEKAQAVQGLQAMQQQQMAVAQQAQMMGQEPPPMQPPPPALLQAAQSPSWDDILGMLRDDIQRSYRIDIETNSTVDAEATEDKKDMAEVLNAISQFLSGIGPLVQSGTMPFEIAQGMLLTVVRRYRLGVEMEDAIKGMKPPQSGASPEEVKKQQKELEAQAAQVKQQHDELLKQQSDAQAQLAKERTAAEQQITAKGQAMQTSAAQQQQDLAFAKQTAEQEIAMARKELAMEKQAALKEIEFAKQMAHQEIAMQEKATLAAADQKIRSKEHALSLKQSAHADMVQRSAEASKGQVADKQTADHNGVLLKGLEKVGTSIVDGLANAKPKTARKQPDGTWKTE